MLRKYQLFFVSAEPFLFPFFIFPTQDGTPCMLPTAVGKHARCPINAECTYETVKRSTFVLF
jgi:hypothetical protein